MKRSVNGLLWLVTHDACETIHFVREFGRYLVSSLLDMRILFFGRYDPGYARNRVLMKGLRMAGCDIIECCVEPKGRSWPLRLVWRYLRMRPRFDVMLVAFPGQEAMFLARMLTRKPIVFDAFASHYGGYILDRKKASPRSFRAWRYRFLDRWSCRLASQVLLDTQEHINFFIREYGLSPKKFNRVFVGTDSDIMHPASAEPVGSFTIHFHGTNIPLQGIPHILQAAEFLTGKGMMFNLIGVNRPRVPYEQLVPAMAGAHVCLGVFGETPKTPLVIPNKIYEAIAMRKAVITADTPAIRELFTDEDMLLVPAGDARALADAIVRLRDDPALRTALAEHGHATLLAHATPALIGRQLARLCSSLLP